MTTRRTAARLTRLALVAVLAALLSGPLAGLADSVEVAPEPLACETPTIQKARYAEAAADTSDDLGVPDPIPYAAPVGTVAGADAIGRVEATLGQVVACVNEGRTGSFLNLFTTVWLSAHVGDFGELPDDAAPTPIAADERLSLVEVADVAILADGRVAALVVFDQSEREGPELTSVMTFAEVDGRLLIDGWQPVTLPEDTAPTPAPGPCDGATPALDAVCDPTPTPVAEAWESVSGPGYTGVVAPLDRAPLFRTGYGDQASGWWLPTAEEIAALEAALPNYLRTFSDDRTLALADKVGTYERQYAGLVVEGRALIFVNALCEDPTGGRWTSEPVFVDDGGDCFFQLYYEPSTGGFRELSINGEA